MNKQQLRLQKETESYYIKYMFYTYLLKCADGTLYCGYTNNLDKRVKTHNEGKGAKYTKVRRPVTLVYYEQYEDKSQAMSREWHIKKLTRTQKEDLIRGAGNNE